MSTRTPSEVAHLWFGEMWNSRDTGMIHELMAPAAKGIFEGGRTMTGPEDFMAFQKDFLDAVPDLKVELLRTITEGDEICVHWRGSGLHSGVGLGCAPSGKQIEFEGITWLTVKDGQIVEGRDFWNQGGLMERVAG
ncbi:ester cyclase [Luteolibacter flavescens]|uniref:Ester cyclase n=1 Tax=Luteolibacter flavescens TaxID=1859460 RepID=A0ABT3FSF4_9BACT|nr:ester cyclase [Luteolibacter flavescens]MCW1885910.1 ester cyclase [Luteolibacter flavescens]